MKVLVVGAGIVGLATAARLAARGDDVVVVDKEPSLAAHQTGRNSGVVHSGLYYPTGSLKARLGRAGAASITALAREHGVPVETPGKLVVAVDESELAGLRRLEERALANGVPARWLGPAEAREHEPEVACVAALRVETTGIIDYPGICRVLAGQVEAAGGTIRLGWAFEGAQEGRDGLRVLLSRPAGGGIGGKAEVERLSVDALVACAGLHADRVARACGREVDVRIVPFRGEYVDLTPEASPLVRGLIYPVPDPRFPFLGVHLTRSVSGHVHAGPNAVLALAREGYTWRDVSGRDLAEVASWPGVWRLAARNLRPGAAEVMRSLSMQLFARAVARLVPAVEERHLRPAPAGVRAQALARDGSLVDDFLLTTGPRQLHVLNAPSPAATASLEIAAHIVRRLDEEVLPQS
ncbi:L-2-hydroxyglutarate oxidase [Salana multivorans]